MADETLASRRLALPPHWRAPLAALLPLLAAIVLLYRHTALGMADIWSRSDTYAHGFVVPLISLWLVWRMRHALAAQVPQASGLAALLMLGAAGLWLAGDLVAVNAVTQFALVALLVLAVPAVLGWRVTRTMAFPLGFLFFAVPIGDFMLPVLMERTADFTVLALRWTGVPVYREGLQFVIPSGSWSVVEACSGIRYLIASVTVGCLFAHLSYQSAFKRWVFIGVSIAVPLVANWVRAYMIVMIGHLSGNELATGVDHLVYGWVFFGIVILIMLLIGARWADAPAPVAAATATFSTPQPVAARRGRASGLVALLALAVVASPHLLQHALALGGHTGPVRLAAPAVAAPWRAEARPPSAWVPSFQFPLATLNQGYTDGQGGQVGLHLSYYRQQDYQRKLVSSENMLVTSQDPDWSRVEGGSAQATLAGQPLTVSEALLRSQHVGTGSNAERLLVWRFYWVNDRFTASDAMAKVQGALGRVTGQGDDGAIVALHTPLASGQTPAQAREVLAGFLAGQGAGLQAALRATRSAVDH